MNTTKLEFVEEIFVELYNTLSKNKKLKSIVDQEALKSLFYVCSGPGSLTQKQSAFVIRLIKKYRNDWPANYTEALATPKFKRPFRVADSKQAWIEQIHGELMVLLKYPYALKNEFERTFLPSESIWIPEKSARGFKFYSGHVEKAYTFAKRHGFNISSQLEEACKFVKTQQKKTPTPHCIVKNNQVILVNASTTANEYFNSKKKGDKKSDLMLAKGMGYSLKKQNDPDDLDMFAALASADTNSFWVDSYTKLFDLVKHSVLPVLLIVDRSSLPVDWIQRFIENAKFSGVDYSVKVLTDASSPVELVEYASKTHYNDSTSNNKIFITVHSLQSWFPCQEPVGMVVTNMINIPTNTLTREYLSSHPVTVYFSTVRPTVKGAEIANL